MNNKYQFEDEVLEKYSKEIYDAAEDSFDMLPLCATIDNRVFVVHGGLFSTAPTMKDIANLNRKREIPIGSTDPGSVLMIEMLWSDPRPEPGRGTSKRGAGMLSHRLSFCLSVCCISVCGRYSSLQASSSALM